jgi:hypothetical protein
MSMRRQLTGEGRKVYAISTLYHYPFSCAETRFHLYITVTLHTEFEFPPLKRFSPSLHKRDRYAFVIHHGASRDGESLDAFSYRHEKFPMHLDLQLSLGILGLDE